MNVVAQQIIDQSILLLIEGLYGRNGQVLIIDLGGEDAPAIFDGKSGRNTSKEAERSKQEDDRDQRQEATPQPPFPAPLCCRGSVGAVFSCPSVGADRLTRAAEDRLYGTCSHTIPQRPEDRRSSD